MVDPFVPFFCEKLSVGFVRKESWRKGQQTCHNTSDQIQGGINNVINILSGMRTRSFRKRSSLSELRAPDAACAGRRAKGCGGSAGSGRRLSAVVVCTDRDPRGCAAVRDVLCPAADRRPGKCQRECKHGGPPCVDRA